MDIFDAQFERVDEGYIYYPSAKSGGKLVSAEEYEGLRQQWYRSIAGKGFWVLIGILGIAIALYGVLDSTFNLPGWVLTLYLLSLSCAMMVWLYYIALAPNRLIKDRPDFQPPRDRHQAQADIRQGVPWSAITVFMLMSGLLLAAKLWAGPNGIGDWVIIVSCGVSFVLFAWTAHMKRQDERSEDR